MNVVERMARAIYETQDNPVPWDSETLGDWRRDYEREKARAALAVVRDDDRGAVADRDALRLMLSRLLDVALVDGYGETVADEARALLTTIGGAVAR